MTYTFEIRNNKTNETSEQTGINFKEACAKAGWKVYDCKCVYRAPKIVELEMGKAYKL